MSAQRTDTIFIEENCYPLYCLPLKQYFETMDTPLHFFSLNTGNTRGYFATWLLENKKLFLIDFWGVNLYKRKEYFLSDIFPGKSKVPAEWFTGDLEIPVGKEVSYFHGGLGGGRYEYNAIIKIEMGVVVDTSFTDNPIHQ